MAAAVAPVDESAGSGLGESLVTGGDELAIARRRRWWWTPPTVRMRWRTPAGTVGGPGRCRPRRRSGWSGRRIAVVAGFGRGVGRLGGGLRRCHGGRIGVGGAGIRSGGDRLAGGRRSRSRSRIVTRRPAMWIGRLRGGGCAFVDRILGRHRAGGRIGRFVRRGRSG